MFTTRPRVETVALPGGQVCLVVDNALAEPHRWCDVATRHAGKFAPDRHAGYPVWRVPLPGPVLTPMHVFFSEWLRDRLGFRRVLDGLGWLSLASAPATAPSRASAVGAGQGTGVLSIFLFDDPAMGGLVFPPSLFDAGGSPPRIEPRYNRLVAFDGSCWHAPDIRDASRLSDQPLHGRLTMDARFTCRRRLQ